jgi:hypothetical protein
MVLTTEQLTHEAARRKSGEEGSAMQGTLLTIAALVLSAGLA